MIQPISVFGLTAMLLVARVVGVVVGLIVGVIVDEALFPDTEWTSAITPLIFAIAGWVAASALVRWLRARKTAT